MAYAVQFRRGTTAQHASFTGVAGEVTVNTDTNELIVHDGTTVGGHVIGTSNSSGGGASTLTDLNITDGTPGQVLTTDGAGTFTFTTLSSGSSGSTTDLSTIISPAAFAYVNTTSDGSGTNISWANWNASSGSMDFTFTTSQPDTNYAVISDVEGYDDTNIMVTSKTTTGFQISIYDDNGNVRSPGSTATFSVIVYSSVPTLSGTTSSTSTGSANVEIYTDMAALIAKTGMSTGDQAYISSTDKLYLYTGTGWYLIATVQNDAPSAITNVDSAYNLASDGTPTVITAVSTDPEGFPLTWSYAITSGSLGSTATISQTDNVFTITPSTNSADDGTFTLTISATDGTNGAVNANTSISLVFNVANSRYTTLLATATETSDNSNVTDSSTNNHVVTVRGDIRSGTSSPYRSGGYSTYFDGTGDYLETSSTSSDNFNFGTDDFTVECFIRNVSSPGQYFDILGTANNAGYVGSNRGGWMLSYYTSQNLRFSYQYNNAWIFENSFANALNINTWYHIAVTRQGNQLKCFVDGNQVGSTITDSTNLISTEPFNVGRGYGGTITTNSYIQDVRITKGLARYTANFTPPTDPVESDANTSLLISSSLPYIKDSSSNSHDITVTGDVSIMPFGPYDYTEYNPNVHGGSVYFPGGGAATFTPTDAGFGFGTGDYTVEGWFNFDDNVAFTGGDGSTILTTTNQLPGVSVHLWVQASLLYLHIGGVDRIVSSTVSTKEWHHIAIVRSSGNTKLYIDGTQEGSTYADSNDYGTTAPFSIGSYHTNGLQGPSSKNMIGYVSDLKVIKGQAIYTSNFTSPTAPLSSTGTGIHIKGTDASIIDKSQSDSHLTLFGNTTGSTTQVKFTDSKSMYFDGTGYVRVEDLGIGPLVTNEGFTIETWVNPTVLYSGNRAIFGLNKISNGDNVIVFTGMEGGAIYYGSTSYWTTSTNVPENEWSHVAVVVVGTLLKTYLNGSEVMSQTYSGLSTINWDDLILAIGGEFDSGGGGGIGNRIEGYIQDFRITKGLARYTATFTPPTLPLKG